MSKQVNHVNIEPEICMETGLPTGSMMNYNFFVNPFTSCKTVIMQTIQELVTLKNHSNNGFAILHRINLAFSLGDILNSNLFVNPFSSDAYWTHKKV